MEEGSLRLVREFLNTRDLATGADALSDRKGAGNWLRRNELTRSNAPLTEVDRAYLVKLREAVRGLLAGDRAAARVLNAATRRSRLRPEFDRSGTVRLVPNGTGVDRIAGTLLVVIAEAMTDGRWARLKVCRRDDCREAFFDASRGGTGKWCSMAVCGNRSKAAAWRARRRG